MQRLYSLILVFLMLSCQTRNEFSVNDVIPKPASMKPGNGIFRLTESSSIIIPAGEEEVQKIAEYLGGRLRTATGYKLQVSSGKAEKGSGNIILAIENDATLGDEGYMLSVDENEIRLRSGTPAGLFRGVQTIRQLFPPSIEMSSKQPGPWEIQTTEIRDFPTYPFRASMLDVGRHFFSVDDVKRYIDLIAFYKMNTLHLHLSDDQGWRIEIKSWPNLTAIGSTSEVGDGKGGFYTQEEYKDIVRYAAERYITIIPEIDMPGHTNAALASYPELNCSGKATELYRGTEVGFSTLCVGKEITYKFVDDVVRELAAMTPGPYIHLGGDESHATKHEDYIPFVEKAQEIVASHGKQMIGWEEIAQSKLRPNTIVQYWSNAKHAQEAARKGARIIMSPATKVYLDMKYDSTTQLGQDWAARIEIDSSYNWNPATRVPGITKENILGIEAPLWTETITNMDEIEYMIFPRIPGIAELGWSPSEGLSWDEYKVRLGKHAARFRAMDINFYQSKQISWE